MTIKRNTKGQFIKGNRNWLGKKHPPEFSLLMSEIKQGTWTKEKNPRWKGGEIKKHCLNCGKEYLIRRYAINRSKFCSRSCKNRYIHTGEKNNNWKGGISKERDKLKSSENYKKWRLKVFQRDKFTCRKCGYRSKKSKAHGDKRSDIEAHHIETIKAKPNLCLKVGNGITLCEKCHKLTYGKEKKFAKVFKEILNDYTKNFRKENDIV